MCRLYFELFLSPQSIILVLKLTSRTDLLYPLKEKFADSWDRSFTNKIPGALRKFRDVSEKSLRSFHTTIKAQLQQRITLNNILSLQIQLTARVEGLTHMVREVGNDITRLQRETNREFYPAIQEAMSETYEQCVRENGKCHWT